MKTLIFALLFTVGAMASEKTTFDILPGKLHKGGFLTAEPELMPHSDSMMIQMKYEILKKGIVPVPSEFLKGTYEQKLPSKFLDERGYLELEKNKSMKIDEATVKYLGRTDYRGQNDAYYVQIIPDNRKSEIFLVYHPTAPGLGWDKVRLVLHTGLPMLDDYVLEGRSR